MRRLILLGLFGSLALTACAQEPLLPPPKKNDWFTKAVTKFETTVTPAEQLFSMVSSAATPPTTETINPTINASTQWRLNQSII